MQLSIWSLLRTGRISKSTLLGGILGVIIILIGLGVLSYFLFPGSQKFFSDYSAKLLAGISSVSKFFTMTPQAPQEETPTSTFASPTEKLSQEVIKQMESKKYIEEAQKGEGITHLARKALKEYLKENPQEFTLTPEHKVYIEDYLAKKMGGGWLQLGEKMEFSQEMINEAIQKAETLTPKQLENLTQYSHLVPSLNY